MTELLIDGKSCFVSAGETILDAARKEGIDIPALCVYPGLPPNTSCMICLVEDTSTGELVPSCSARAGDYSSVETGNARVLAARKAALELLLSEHLGDCEAPCRRACPGFTDLPRLIRRIAKGNIPKAGEIYRAHLPFPGILAEICPAPCERNCRRGGFDEAIAIRRFEAAMAAADHDAIASRKRREVPGRAAVIGAGPAGLSAAFYLSRWGRRCDLFDAAGEPGGALVGLVETDVLTRDTLDSAVLELHRGGVEFHPRRVVSLHDELPRLAQEYETVIIAVGWKEDTAAPRLTYPGRSGAQAVDGYSAVFAAGDAVRGRSTRLAARSMAEGRDAAYMADAAIRQSVAAERRKTFDSHAGRLTVDEIESISRGVSAGTVPGVDSIVSEASRCLQCDCVSADSCQLREYADRYSAEQRRFAAGERPRFERTTDRNEAGDTIALEPGKCIRCGICVALSRRERGASGLTFYGRGAELRITVPFGDSLWAGLPDTAALCARACPTGALAFHRS